MPYVLPYSYSSLTSFETCAHKHYMEKVAKLVKRPEYKQAADGIALHSQAEQFIVDSKPFEGIYAPKVMSVVNDMKKNVEDAVIGTEVKLCVTRDMQPCDWFAKNAHTRGVLDVLQISGDTADIKDWKTGKADPFSMQLRHNSMLVFIHNPQVQVVNTEYVWLKMGYSTKAKVRREFLEETWKNFEKRVIMMEKALAANNWPKKKSGLCKNYCAVNTCEHNGNYGIPTDAN